MLLVTVSVQRGLDGRLHACIDGLGPTQISAALAGNGLRKVAGPAAAVHRFAFGRETKTLLRPLVGFDLAFALAFAHSFTPDR